MPVWRFLLRGHFQLVNVFSIDKELAIISKEVYMCHERQLEPHPWR